MTRKVVACISLLFVLALASTNIAGVTGFSDKPVSNKPSGTSPSGAQDIKRVEAEIKRLDDAKEEIEASMDTLETVLKGLEKGKMLVIPFGPNAVPGDKEKFTEYLSAKVMAGSMSEKLAAKMLADAAALTGAFKSQIKRDLQELRKDLKQTQAQKTRALTQLTGLAEADTEQTGTGLDKAEKSKESESASEAGKATDKVKANAGEPEEPAAGKASDKTTTKVANKPSTAKKPEHNKPPQ